MPRPTTRRQLLHGVARGATLAGVGGFGFLRHLGTVSAAEAQLDPEHVRFAPEIEPLVKLLETTPRPRLLEEIGARIRGGLSYREVLASLLLAGVRNIQPRPSVGFKFHAVLVVNSAHLASLASSDEDRWLPIFWALDYFKSSQAQDERQGDWTLGVVDESAVPPVHRARRAFIEAMDQWDEVAADAAAAGLARTAGAHELFELLCRYGARDYRSIGHKAIFVANSWRTLQCIGWQHAEPILRSLVYALLNHHGEPDPSRNDLAPDRPWRRNQELAGEIRASWQSGTADAGAVPELLATVREGSPADASRKVIELLNRDIAPQSVWDGLFAGAAELLLRRPGIVALHAVTTTNALHYAWQASANDETRRLLLLQNAAFLPLFRESMKRRGRVSDQRIDRIEPIESEANGSDAISRVFAEVSRDPVAAARLLLAHLESGGQAGGVIDAARRLVFLKGDDPHDYKFSSAVLEDYAWLSPQWRRKFLAASVVKLPGLGSPDNDLVSRTRAALEA